MDLIHQNHHFHFFSNNSDVEPSPTVIGDLLEAFSEYQLVPVPSNEYNTLTGQNRDYVTLITPDHRLRLEFPSNEIIIYSFGDESQDEFRSTTIKIISILSTLFPLKMANRLSVLNSIYFKGEVQQYDSLYKKLFTFKKVSPFEWDNRIVEKIALDDIGEEINSISSIRRSVVSSQFFKSQSPMDLINFNIDSNTVYQNQQQRFRLKDCQLVVDRLFENNSKIITELQRYF
ncbi:hypothetical protein KDD30_00765 [Photobacterium sp. GJ3]|uniref:hypothetical protein n=1 Tax=Photobacterium sp. GJ3 TaxID=2829502 RepID=UPI001B8D4285|nr:hypothetical protein [Photobacterium sp. GJ3]QUJ67745.1 hypothetical protein KDD30_00765 [Photobacterium sp. GJ3]